MFSLLVGSADLKRPVGSLHSKPAPLIVYDKDSNKSGGDAPCDGDMPRDGDTPCDGSTPCVGDVPSSSHSIHSPASGDAEEECELIIGDTPRPLRHRLSVKPTLHKLSF